MIDIQREAISYFFPTLSASENTNKANTTNEMQILRVDNIGASNFKSFSNYVHNIYSKLLFMR